MQTHPESPGQQSGRVEHRLNFRQSYPAIGGLGGCEKKIGRVGEKNMRGCVGWAEREDVREGGGREEGTVEGGKCERVR